MGGKNWAGVGMPAQGRGQGRDVAVRLCPCAVWPQFRPLCFLYSSAPSATAGTALRNPVGKLGPPQDKGTKVAQGLKKP